MTHDGGNEIRDKDRSYTVPRTATCMDEVRRQVGMQEAARCLGMDRGGV